MHSQEFVPGEDADTSVGQASAVRSGRGRLLLIAKVLVTILLCTIIVWHANWGRMLQGLREANGFLVAVVFFSMVLCVTISTYKWQLLLRIHGARFPFGHLHRLYFTSMFLNNFLPTSIGGDGYRIYRTLKNQRSKTVAFLAVFMERLIGIASLLMIGFFAALIGYSTGANALSRMTIIVGVVGIAIGTPFLLLAFNRRFVSWLTSLRKFPDLLRNIVDYLGDYRREPARTWRVILVSFGFHFFTVWWLMLLIDATGGSIAYYEVAVVCAVLSVVAVIPLSINGLGLVDGAFIYLVGFYGVHYEVALMTALLQRALMVPISLAGGLIYLFDERRSRARGEEESTQDAALRSRR
ncbi:MAG: lysylphosphatidylglycerol synthase transmembrane domain-containing protein [Arenicellales bacterium]